MQQAPRCPKAVSSWRCAALLNCHSSPHSHPAAGEFLCSEAPATRPRPIVKCRTPDPALLGISIRAARMRKPTSQWSQPRADARLVTLSITFRSNEGQASKTKHQPQALIHIAKHVGGQRSPSLCQQFAIQREKLRYVHDRWFGKAGLTLSNPDISWCVAEGEIRRDHRDNHSGNAALIEWIRLDNHYRPSKTRARTRRSREGSPPNLTTFHWRGILAADEQTHHRLSSFSWNRQRSVLP